ncbi:hypothetical protein BROUX41_003412 [Berkeleyomyces rouxiae]|uniref:uncharacterized protein n=1 Tax=Berkeleyomyces rouxiae TaxID=2035830 RepID=UPI003B76B49B
MARYSLLFLSLAAAPLASAWPQLFDTTATNIAAREGPAAPRIPYEAIKIRTTTPDVSEAAENALPNQPADEKRQLVRSAKFRGRALPVIADDGLTFTLPVTINNRGLQTRDSAAVPEFKITLVRSNARAPRGLPVVDSDPDSLYKITIPISAKQKRALPVIDSDPDALFKITLPTVSGSKRSAAGDDSVIELPAHFKVVEDRGLPVTTDPAEAFEVTLPVALNPRGLPVVSDDPDSLFKITLPLTKEPSASTPSATKRETSSLSSLPNLRLHVPVSNSAKAKRALPTGTVADGSEFSITLPVSISNKEKRQHEATGKHSVTLRPPTEDENVAVKPYAEKRQHTPTGEHTVTLRPPTEAENVRVKPYAEKRQHTPSGEHTVTIRPPTEAENVPVKPYSGPVQRRAEYSQKVRRTAEGVLKMPVIRAEKPGLQRRGGREVDQALEKLQKRADGDAISVAIANRSDVAYYAQLDFGTPPQPIYVQIDTGSFELWVNPSCNSLTAGDKVFCEAVGQYDPETSSTSAGLKETKNLRYGIGAANITYFSDSIGMGGSASMNGVQFGVANSTEDQFAGILGMGYGSGTTTTYKNFVDELADQNITHSRTFSLGLGAKDNMEGVLVFGGVDSAKFSGPLTKLPIIPASKAPDGVPRYWVQMENITLTKPDGEVSAAYEGSDIPAFLDSGATLTLLPPKVADAIAADFGATEGVSSNGFYSVDCAMATASGSLDFAFNGLTVQVPYHEMVRTLATTPPSCWLGMIPSTDFTLLGDTFLRSVYAVFDVDNECAYLAPYQNCGEELVSLGNGMTPSDVQGLCKPAIVETSASATATATATATTTSAEAASETADRKDSKTTTSDLENTQTTEPTAEPTGLYPSTGGSAYFTGTGPKTTHTPVPTGSGSVKKPGSSDATATTTTTLETPAPTTLSPTDKTPLSESYAPGAIESSAPSAVPAAPAPAPAPATDGTNTGTNTGSGSNPADPASPAGVSAPADAVTTPLPSGGALASGSLRNGTVQTAGAARARGALGATWGAVAIVGILGAASVF